ncbi:GFA family protein [Pseudanabaena sp. FACHB-2040]|uniref:GFA family protein n=1 Tax=Pseudanabaena sp. FACHB-2040 TaxID=2692859 RepID=UPI001687D626|nr:GFA family protein [Pseudanabaena sp. FACHB-2040]MBD2259668.1 GFA family protein [Pseudanabaena sp. FACHB-2040]
MTELVGGCFCGAVRYLSTAPVIDAGYCHCRICQGTCGAPAVVWISVPAAGFAFTRGNPSAFESSPRGIRYFCPTCGTQVTFRRPDSDEVDINSLSLDDPEAVLPEYHVWINTQLSWFKLQDSLPRYEDDGPDR